MSDIILRYQQFNHKRTIFLKNLANFDKKVVSDFSINSNLLRSDYHKALIFLSCNNISSNYY